MKAKFSLTLMDFGSGLMDNLVNYFLNKHIIIDNGNFTVEGILLAFKPSRKYPFHEPFTLIVLTKHGKVLVRDWMMIKRR